MAGGDFIDQDDPAVIRGPLTAEIASIRSPVRQFLGEWFTSGLRDLQRRYREAAPSLAVPGVDRADADPEPWAQPPTGSCGSSCTRNQIGIWRCWASCDARERRSTC
jgi:hypothetical protein